jgi:hypothetical protein
MRPANFLPKLSSTLVLIAASAAIATQYTSMGGTIAAGAGAALGSVAAHRATRRGARLEALITLCPFLGALLMLACNGLHQSKLAQVSIWGATAFCVSLAMDLFRAEYPQGAALRVILILASFVSLLAKYFEGSRPYSLIDLVLHAERDPVHFFLLTGILVAVGGVGVCVANPQLTVTRSSLRLSRLLALSAQDRLNPPANSHS